MKSIVTSQYQYVGAIKFYTQTHKTSILVKTLDTDGPLLDERYIDWIIHLP